MGEGRQSRFELSRRRQLGLLVGALLAWLIGGLPGLVAALLLVALVRGLEYWWRKRAPAE